MWVYIERTQFQTKMKILNQSHSAKKLKRGDPLCFSKPQFAAKYQKELKGDPYQTEKKWGKNRTVPKKSKGGPYSLVRFCIVR